MSARWDRDRLERERYGLDDRYAPAPRRTTEVLLDERIRRTPGGYDERERYVEEERYLPARRAPPAFLDDPVPAEVSRQALAPYRRPRPQIIRKQSSLDTFDRRSVRRDDYRLPAEVPIPLPIRRRPLSPGRSERYYEEVEERYRDSDEEYRDVRVARGTGRSRSRVRSRSVRRRRRSVSSSSSSSSETTTTATTKTVVVGRRGRTKVPKRLAHREALIELGYPFVEEDNFLIVQRALDKVHIDRIVEISKKFREDKTVTYKYDGVAEEKKEVVEEVVREKEFVSAPRSVIAPSTTFDDVSVGESADEIIRKRIITTTTIDPPDHHHRHQDLAVAVPRHHQSEHEIRREIRALEAEAESLRLERRSERSERDFEVESTRSGRESTRSGRKDIYRVERSRNGRLALIRSAH